MKYLLFTGDHFPVKTSRSIESKYFIVDLDVDKEERTMHHELPKKIIRSQRHKFLFLAFTI